MSTYQFLLIAFLVFAGILTVSISLILINRARYKKSILNLKLNELLTKVIVDEAYWYNSGRGFLNSVEPSCWATVLSKPKIVSKNKVIVVDVLLKIGEERIEKTVPANSLIKIDRLTS